MQNAVQKVLTSCTKSSYTPSVHIRWKYPEGVKIAENLVWYARKLICSATYCITEPGYTESANKIICTNIVYVSNVPSYCQVYLKTKEIYDLFQRQNLQIHFSVVFLVFVFFLREMFLEHQMFDTMIALQTIRHKSI